MRMCIWQGTHAEDDDSYFAGLDEDMSKEILITILKMDDNQKENRWEAEIVRKPKLGLIYVALRKNLAGGECKGLIVVGRCEPPNPYGPSGMYDRAKFKPGRAKFSLNGTAYMTPFELREMALAVAEAEVVWDNFVKTDTMNTKWVQR